MLINQATDFLALLFPLTCSLCLINSIVTASVTKVVSRFDTGSVLGLNMAIHSAIRYVLLFFFLNNAPCKTDALIIKQTIK